MFQSRSSYRWIMSVNEKTIRALVEAGAVKNVLLIADGSTVHVDIVTQAGSITATTTKGQIKTWATIRSETPANGLKQIPKGTTNIET